MSDSDQNDVLDFMKPQGLTLQNTLPPSGVGNVGGQSMAGNPLMPGTGAGMGAFDGNQPFTFYNAHPGDDARRDDLTVPRDPYGKADDDALNVVPTTGQQTVKGDELSLLPGGSQGVVDWMKPQGQYLREGVGGAGDAGSYPQMQGDGWTANANSQWQELKSTGEASNALVQSGGSQVQFNVPSYPSQMYDGAQKSDAGGASSPSGGISIARPAGQDGQGVDAGKTFPLSGGLSIKAPQVNMPPGAPGAGVDGDATPQGNAANDVQLTGHNIYSGGSSPREAKPAVRNEQWNDEVPSDFTKDRQRDFLGLSIASYEDDGGQQKGLIPKNKVVVSPDEMRRLGLKPEWFNDSVSGFNSTLYKDTVTGEYTLAFRGTESKNWGDRNDWETDVVQEVGAGGKQYEETINLARALDKAMKANNARLTFTGHSLGGGEATAAALATGRRAVTFNAAPVNQETLLQAGIVYNANNSQRLVTSFYVPGEALSVLNTITPSLNYMAGGYLPRGLRPPPALANIEGKRIGLDTNAGWDSLFEKHKTPALQDSMKP